MTLAYLDVVGFNSKQPNLYNPYPNISGHTFFSHRINQTFYCLAGDGPLKIATSASHSAMNSKLRQGIIPFLLMTPTNILEYLLSAPNIPMKDETHEPIKDNGDALLLLMYLPILLFYCVNLFATVVIYLPLSIALTIALIPIIGLIDIGARFKLYFLEKDLMTKYTKLEKNEKDIAEILKQHITYTSHFDDINENLISSTTKFEISVSLYKDSSKCDEVKLLKYPWNPRTKAYIEAFARLDATIGRNLTNVIQSCPLQDTNKSEEEIIKCSF